MLNTNKIFSLVMLIFLLAFNPSHAEWFKADRAIMGTAIHIELWHTDEAIAERNIQKVISEMHRIDSLMSPYKKDSELSLINETSCKASRQN